MSAQYVMCVRSVAINGQVIAEKGKKYTYRDSSTCTTCSKTRIAVEEIQHKQLHPCFPGDSWMPSECFIPLNDPKLNEEPEHYITKAPTTPASPIDKRETEKTA